MQCQHYPSCNICLCQGYLAGKYQDALGHQAAPQDLFLPSQYSFVCWLQNCFTPALWYQLEM